MLTERTKFGFRTVKSYFADDIDKLHASRKYSSIIAMSYKKMDIPGFIRTEKTTAFIDTSVPEEKIYARFSEREKISKTYKIQGLRFVSDDCNPQIVYRIYSDFEFSQGRAPIKMVDFDRFKLFTAYYHDEPISGINIIEDRPYIRIRSIFSKRMNVDDKARYRIIASSTRRLMWELCRWAHQNGYHLIDLASVNLTDPSKKGISDFKMSFGGMIVPEYTYTYKSRLFRSLEVFARINVELRKLARKVIGR